MTLPLLDYWFNSINDENTVDDGSGRIRQPRVVLLAPDAVDHAIVDRLRSGDVSVLEIWFREYTPNLLRFAERLGLERMDADAVVTDVFLDLWNRRESLDTALRVRPYLYAAVRNRAANVHRSATREARRHARLAIYNVEKSPVAPNAEVGEEAAQVWAAARNLPESQRVALELRFAHELSIAEVAQVMEISAPAVKMLLQRAIRTLRERLHGIFEQM